MRKLAITAMGAVTSVGMNAVTTCASIRAGLARPVALDCGLVLDLEDYKEIPIVGHPAGSIAQGFSNVGRWLQLAPPALKDLCDSGGLPAPTADPAFWAATRLVVVLPVLDDRFVPDPNCSPEALPAAFVAPLQHRVRQFFGPAQTTVHPRGRTGLLEGLSAAREWIAQGHSSRVVLLAVDSLVDRAALDWLSETGRIRCDTNPVGLSPGEAGCALLVEDAASAAERGAAPMAFLGAVSTHAEPQATLAGHASQGKSLSTAIAEVLTRLGSRTPYTGPAIVDLNGETWRAHEFGSARARVPRDLWQGDDVIVPAESVGDTGAATAALQCALACRALARGYAPWDALLMTCSDEHGLVGAATLSNG